MPGQEHHIVTGALGFSGKRIAARLLEAGHRVRTLTNSPAHPNPFGDKLEISGYHFDNLDRMVAAMEGATVLYNTYWVRFNHRGFTFAEAVENSRKLFEAAKRAGVARVVHVSITNPSEDSPLEYFRGKAQVERMLMESGLSYAILRPAVLYGEGDILINNIAWAIRHLPVFGIFGDGQYRLQPIHVDDFAQLAIAQGRERIARVIDAVGPEAFTYRELIERLCEILRKRPMLLNVSPSMGYAATWFLGKVKGDVIITREEIKGLMDGLLYTGSSPTGQTRLTHWTRENADTLGRQYASELARRSKA